MASELKGRRVVVQLGTTGNSGSEYASPSFDIGFEVDMTDSSTPNEGKITLYNVKASTVSTMQKDDAVVRLLVGYESQGGATRLLFQGNPVASGVKLLRGQADDTLVIEAQDGGREYTTQHVSTSYSTATTSGQLFTALAADSGLVLGNVDAVVSTVSFPYGISLTGRISDQLDRLAEISGARWQSRDGTLQVWPIGGSTGESAVLFSSAAGNLVGSPTITDDGVEITGLLDATIRPGKPFRVESRDVTGNYVCTSAQFKGSSGYDTPFYVIAKGSPL